MRLLLFSFLFIYTSQSIAQNTSIYDVSWEKEKYYLGTGVGLFGLSYLFHQGEKPLSLQDVNALNPLDVNGFDRHAIYRFDSKSKSVSDLFRTGILFVPFTAMLTGQGRTQAKDIGIMYFETLLINTSITIATKTATYRVRPFVYNDQVELDSKLNIDASNSFYSGHTSHVAALSVFTATVLSDLYPKSKFKWLWWSGAFALPSLTAYLRVNSGKHFPTDVLTGIALGSAIGYLVPTMHKRDKTNPKLSFQLLPGPGSISLGVTMHLNRL